MKKRIVAVDVNVIEHAINKWKWTAVFLPTMYYDHDMIKAWFTDNCQCRAVYHAAAFVFEKDTDAMFFALKWK